MSTVIPSTLSLELATILHELVADSHKHFTLLSTFLVKNDLINVKLVAAAADLVDLAVSSFTESIKSNTTPLSAAILAQLLRRLIDKCAATIHQTPSPSPSISSATSPSSSSSSPSSAKKRRSEGDTPQQPRLKKFDASKFALLNPESARFWFYVDVFSALLEDDHNESVKCPACSRTLAASNPHNFFNHAHLHCLVRGDAFLSSPAAELITPRSPPPPDVAARLCSLSESALARVPLCWLAMLPPGSLPASIRSLLGGHAGGSAAPAAAGAPLAAGAPADAVPAPAAALRDAPAAFAVPESAPMVVAPEEVLPQDLGRSVGSFGSATSAASLNAFFAPDFQLGHSPNSGT